MATYRRRPAEIEAIQWTDTNADELTAFAAHRFMTIDPEDRADDPDATASLIESAHESWALMHPGDWVVKRGDDFAVLTPDEFTDLYEPAADQAALSARITEVLRPHASLGGTPSRYELPYFDGAPPGLPRISGWRPLDDVVAAVVGVLAAADQAAVCICAHTKQQHFEDACLVCDCGDYLPAAAAREVIARYQEATKRVRAVLETEAVLGRTALDYRGLITAALMGAEAQQPCCTSPELTPNYVKGGTLCTNCGTEDRNGRTTAEEPRP